MKEIENYIIKSATMYLKQAYKTNNIKKDVIDYVAQDICKDILIYLTIFNKDDKKNK